MAANASALVLIIISQLLAIIFFSSSAAADDVTIYHFGDSQFYNVRVSKLGGSELQISMSVDTGKDVAMMPCPTRTNLRDVRCKEKQCRDALATGCPGGGCFLRRWYNGSIQLTSSLEQGDIILDTIKIRNYTFGCINKTSARGYFPRQGMLGLARSPLNILSQNTTNKSYKSTFSYCLSSYNDSRATGFLRLGPGRQPRNTPPPPNTPLLQNKKRPSLYYVKLEGIAVNGNLLTGIRKSALEFNSDTGAGTVFDTGNMFTTLTSSAYNNVIREVRLQMLPLRPRSKNQFDTCYNVTINVKSITFMFANSLNLTVPPRNFIIYMGQSTYCLAMTTSPPTSTNYKANIIGSYQQQNKIVTIDVPNAKLSIVDTTRGHC